MFMRPRGTRCCLHMQACHLDPLRQSQGCCSTLPQCTSHNYSSRKACHLPIVNLPFVNNILKCLAELSPFLCLGSCTQCYGYYNFLFILETEKFPLRNTASITSVLVQINVLHFVFLIRSLLTSSLSTSSSSSPKYSFITCKGEC